MATRSNAGRVGVFGASGSGKSSYVKARLRRAKRVLVFDPLDEYAAEGFESFESGADLFDRIRDGIGAFRLSYVPPSGSEDRAADLLSRIALKVQEPFKAAGRGGELTLVVEEMNTCFHVSGGEQRCKGLAEICSRGRHSGIELVGVSQRINEVATRFRGNCTEVVVFRQEGPRDVTAAMDALGFVDKEQVMSLKNLHYLHKQGGNIQGPKKLRRG